MRDAGRTFAANGGGAAGKNDCFELVAFYPVDAPRLTAAGMHFGINTPRPHTVDPNTLRRHLTGVGLKDDSTQVLLAPQSTAPGNA